MVSTGNEDIWSNLSHQVDCGISDGKECKVNSHVSLQVSTSRKGLLSDEESPKEFPDNATTLSRRLKLLKISPRGGNSLPSGGFCPMADDRDETSCADSPSAKGSFRRSFNNRLFKKIDWRFVMQMSKEWIRKPLNMALFLWMVGVVISGALLFLVMTGMLNSVLPRKSLRDLWFEVNNQIINALFTLMCLYQHPKRFYHLVLLCRWMPEDISQLRKIYCKNTTCKPNERFHMMVVVMLLHLNCFAQYALCVLNLGFRRAERPVAGVGVCLSVAIGAPALAGLYSVLSPLGKDYECDGDEEAPNQLRQSFEKKFAFAAPDESRIFGHKPQWIGGLFSLWQDFSVAYLSLFCCFCVFGWNMERLGFGNTYVHIATFLMFCIAPFLILNLAAVNIDNEAVREILGITGIVLCVFGLLYGGFWRIQMRKRFNLPPNNLCFGKPNVSDCFQWLFCCWCSLAQEVRTGDFYEMVEDGFDKKTSGCEYESHTALTPLPREGTAAAQSMSDLNSSYRINSSLSKIKPSDSTDEIMKPPIPATISTEVEKS